MKRLLVPALLACSSAPTSATGLGAHSASLALSPDGKMLWVVNPDADSVAQIDVATRTLVREILLAGSHPSPDGQGAYTPAVFPRTVAPSTDGTKVWISGERSGKLHEIDVATGAVRASGVLCSEPFGLLAAPDGQSVLVACSQDDVVLRVAVPDFSIQQKTSVASEPVALARSDDGASIYVTHFLVGSVTTLDARTLAVIRTTQIAEIAPRGDKRLAHGKVRGLHDVAPRPQSSELWVVHQLLGVDTAQPDLDFESTVFPALTTIDAAGTVSRTLSTNAQDVPGLNGAFADIVSAPVAIAFTHDGAFALVADESSEDVLVVDTSSGLESSLVRPLPGHQPEGIVIDATDGFAFVQQRNTNDVAVLALVRDDNGLTATVATTIPTLQGADPMPAQLRLGQHLFHSANSDEYPITKNHWVACESCHMEGRSDAVTWLFEQGPRDTPTNAGGMTGTGFLFRTADRNQVQDYWRTINIEQGGSFDPNVPEHSTLLDAVAVYVNQAIPLPVPPTTDPTLVAKGSAIFQSAGCASCHAGARFTDSGTGNTSLDLKGTVVLHDVGTCVTNAAFPDVPHDDVAGDLRAACAFDTPSLNGVASTPPYFHDGSAATLHDAVDRMLAPSNAQGMSAADEAALVEFVRSL